MDGYPLLRKHWDDFSSLPRGRRAVVALTVAFVLYHLGATLAWGAGDKSRVIFGPVFFGYSGVLKATQTWGMFATIDQEQAVSVRGVLRGGGTVELAPPEENWEFSTFVLRRERKVMANLTKDGPYRQFGERYLRAFCAGNSELAQVEMWVAGGRPSAPTPAVRKHRVSCQRRSKP